MPTITQVRSAISNTITAALPEINGYDTVPDVTQVPAVVIRPGKCQYVVGMGNCSKWYYELYVLVARTEASVNQDQLDAYLSATGAKSIPAVIRASPTLGLSGVNAVLEDMIGYGGSWDSAQVHHIGAQLNLCVLITE